MWMADISIVGMALSTSEDPFPLLSLPIELRLEVYNQIRQQSDGLPAIKRAKAKGQVLQTSKLVCTESFPVLYPRHSVSFNAECCKNESATLLHIPPFARESIRYLEVLSYHDDLPFDIASSRLWTPCLASIRSLRRFDWSIEALPFINFCWTLFSLAHNVKRDTSGRCLAAVLHIGKSGVAEKAWRETPNFADEDVLDIFPSGVEICLKRTVTEAEAQHVEEYQRSGWLFEREEELEEDEDERRKYRWKKNSGCHDGIAERTTAVEGEKIRMFRNVDNF